MIRTTRRGNPTETRVAAGDRTRTLTVNALLASAALGTFATGVSAAEFSDARLRVIDGVLKSSRAAHAAAFEADDAAGQPPTVTVSVPPGPLQTVVAVLERTFSVRIALSHPSLGELQSPGVSGAVSLEQALRAVLAGTGADFRGTSASSFLIDLASLSESVSVTGAVAAAEYAGIALLWGASDASIAEPALGSLPHHLGKAAILLVSGIGAGFVARRIRRSFTRAIESIGERQRILSHV